MWRVKIEERWFYTNTSTAHQSFTKKAGWFSHWKGFFFFNYTVAGERSFIYYHSDYVHVNLRGCMVSEASEGCNLVLKQWKHSVKSILILAAANANISEEKGRWCMHLEEQQAANRGRTKTNPSQNTGVTIYLQDTVGGDASFCLKSEILNLFN